MAITHADVTAAIHARKPSLLSSSPEVWPILMALLVKDGVQTLDPARDRRIIVVGTSLGDDAVDVPEEDLLTSVVLHLKNHAFERRYGNGKVLYIRGTKSSWECDLDFTQALACWAVIEDLIQSWRARPHVTLVGCSAGNPKAWSMLAVASPTQLHLVEHVVSIAGAWHPTLLPQIREKLLNSHATVLVHHHSNDRLCPWHGPLNDFWCALAPELAGRYFRSCIDDVESDYVGKSFHTVHVLLCSMRLFWSMLALDARAIAAGTTFATECRERSIGLGHLAHPAGLVPSDYTFCPENMGYSVFGVLFHPFSNGRRNG